MAIEVNRLSKCYQIYGMPHDQLKQLLFPKIQRVFGVPQKQYFSEFWALQDISFTIKKGQISGVIGKNGSGKSTLLQILAGIVSPTEGGVEINGRIAALLELGAGFNPEFSGIENAYLNAQILGLSKQQMNNNIESIKSFADIGDFIFRPVKTYSSGMLARLAFAVAVHVEPEILIVDEALSVGDSWFQHKSMAKMKELMSRGCTVLFVSHSIDAIRALCDKVIWLDKGKMVQYGDVTEVTNAYMNDVFVEQNRIVSQRILASTNTAPAASANLVEEIIPLNSATATMMKIQEINLINSNGVHTDKLLQGEAFSIEVTARFFEPLNNISIGFLIKDQFGQELIGESVFNSCGNGLTIAKESLIRVCFKSHMLLRGGQSYSVALRINQVSKWDRSDNLLLYANDLAMVFDVLIDNNKPMWFQFMQKFDIEVQDV